MIGDRRAAGLGTLAFAVLAFAGTALAQENTDFKDAPGRPVAVKACTACHVASQVTNQRKTKEDWALTVEKMIGFGAQITDAEFETLVGYLAANYPAS